MNQKKTKLKQLEKLKSEAEILYTASKIAISDEHVIEHVISAALILAGHYCPERTKYFKEAIELSEKLERWETAFNLAVIALKKKDENYYFSNIYKKHKGKKEKKPG